MPGWHGGVTGIRVERDRLGGYRANGRHLGHQRIHADIDGAIQGLVQVNPGRVDSLIDGRAVCAQIDGAILRLDRLSPGRFDALISGCGVLPDRLIEARRATAPDHPKNQQSH